MLCVCVTIKTIRTRITPFRHRSVSVPSIRLENLFPNRILGTTVAIPIREQTGLVNGRMSEEAQEEGESVDKSDVNVRVAVRTRPLSSKEKSMGCKECVVMEDKNIKIVDEDGNEKLFAFDFSYWHNVSQNKVYEDLAKPIVMSAIDGFNGVIFAYGQTGSGKTHTMQGSGDDVGIVPLMNKEIFSLLEEKINKNGGEALVTASYLEIYNEVIRDLLNPSDKQLKIREHPKLGIYVEHLAELVVDSAEGIASLLDQGNNVKQVAATQMNERSSRSHCCFIVTIKQRKIEEIGSGEDAVKRETTLTANINLVDLAGSERASKTGAQGSRLKEGAAINLSLATLGQVINMLAEGSKGHVPYRNSKLTRVLQQALGGNARTVMVAAISPADYNYNETLSTLQYASRASKIQNKTVRNEDVSQRMIRELREEVERLRAQMAQLEQLKGPLSPSNTQDEEDLRKMNDMKETIAMLEETKKRQWDEVQKLSKAYEEERNKTLNNEKVVRSIMQNVKEEKVALMRRLNELEQEKAQLLKLMKQTKQDYSVTKNQLEKDMARYQEIMAKPESEQPEDQVNSLFLRIEKNRDQLVEQRALMKDLKDRIKFNQEEQIEQKAEMEAQKLMLDQDAELRKQIQDEEKAKLIEEFSDDPQHARMEVAKFEKSYKKKLERAQRAESETYNKALELELEILNYKSDADMLRAEIRRLQAQLQAEREMASEKLKKTVEQLAEAFQRDQCKLLMALDQVTRDCAFLAKNNGRKFY